VAGHRRRFQDRVSVAAAETEGIHARPRRLSARFGPGLEPLRNAQPQIFERYLRIRLLEVQARGNLAMVQAERRLDQSGDAGTRFQVTYVALDRADDAGVSRPAACSRSSLAWAPNRYALSLGLPVYLLDM
jgi:hypothetical protein